MSQRIVGWSVVAIGMLFVASAQARPIPLVKSSARSSMSVTYQVVGNGVYPPTTSRCYPSAPSTILFRNNSIFMTAPLVVGVYWPGAQSPDPWVRSLFPDFVTDLCNGPYWNAVMPQYVGAAHGVYQTSVRITTLLTVAPSTTVYVRQIAGELVAQQKAAVLPAPDPQGNTLYVVHFPPGITITDDSPTASIGTSCVDFCAYHDHYYDGTEPRTSRSS